MDGQTRTAIIAAAYATAGPIGASDDPVAAAEEHRARVIEAIAEITVAATDEKSWANRAIDQVAGPDVKIFTGTVIKVTKEESTTRGIVHLRTRIHPEYAPDGIEQVRTERTDDPVGLAMARRIRAFKGHRVIMWVEMEQFTNKQGSTRKSRVVRHVQDLGPARAEEADAA